MRCATSRLLWLVLDVLLYTSVAAGLALTLLGVVTPRSARVTCDDPSIRKPFTGDSISVTMLIVVCLFVPLFVMTLVEWAVPPKGVSAPTLRAGVTRAWRYTCDIFVGGLFMFFLNDVAKTLVAEPRPHFWHTCLPNITQDMCTQPYVEVSWQNCTNPQGLIHPKLIDSMKSFPSGHASLSVFSTVFMIVFIKQRLWGRSSRLLAPWLMLVWCLWAVVCCQSRVWDNRHHWWDVLAGGILGGVGALFTVHYMSDWFARDLETSGETYTRQDEREARYSRTSIRRLISTTSDAENHNDYRLDDRELKDVNGAP